MTISEFKNLTIIEGFELADYTVTFICTMFSLENWATERWSRDIQYNYNNNYNSEDCKVNGLTYHQFINSYDGVISGDLDFITAILDKYGIFFPEDISGFGNTVKIKNFDSYVTDNAILNELEIVHLNVKNHTLDIQVGNINSEEELELWSAIFSRH